MPRTEVYQLRLTPEEKADLARRAREADLSIAGLIRNWAGLSGASPARKPPAPDDLTERMIAAVVGKKPKPSSEQIEEMATRIYNTEGVPMSVARRRAKERLSA